MIQSDWDSQGGAVAVYVAQDQMTKASRPHWVKKKNKKNN